jgi:S-phase kinase-associated protein 1
MTMPMIKIMTSDEVEMSISVENAKQMTTIKNMMDDIGADIVAPLPNVDHETMVKIEAYILHHANDPPESEKKEDTKQTDEIVPWDRDFIAVSQTTLFKLTLAANYLEFKKLLDLCCKTIAGQLRGKTPEEIRKVFNIKNDFTPEEEAAVRKENEWVEER